MRRFKKWEIGRCVTRALSFSKDYWVSYGSNIGPHDPRRFYPTTCTVCNGEGLVDYEWEAPNGNTADVMITCNECEGLGKIA